MFASQSFREQWESQWKVFSARIEARGEKDCTSPEFKHHAYQSTAKPVSLSNPRIPLIRPPAKASLEQPVDSDLVPPLINIRIPEDAILGRAWRDHSDDLTTDFTIAKPFCETDDSNPHTLTNPPESSNLERIASTQIGNTVLELRPVDDIPISSVSEQKPDSRPKAINTEGQPELAGTELNDLLSSVCESNERSNISSASGSTRGQNDGAQFRHLTTERIESNVESESRVKNQHALALSKGTEWPLVKDILKPHGAGPLHRSTGKSGENGRKKKPRADSTPTFAETPRYWTPPVWLVGPAAAVVVVSSGLLGCSLSWCWTYDAYAASIVTDRLLTGDRVIQRSALIGSVIPPRGSWVVSTAPHLAQWAIFRSRYGRENDRSNTETGDLLKQALTASPINATARFALAQLRSVRNANNIPIESLGLSRDAISLAFTARRLLECGQKQAALKLYTCALSVAIRGEEYYFALPRFSEDPSVPRFLLPGEEEVHDIVVDLVSQHAWTFHEWSSALPENPIVLITTARLLRELGRNEAETVFDRLINSKLIAKSSKNASAIVLAARAEAFALQSHWREADQLYRHAIDLVDDPTIARSWWFNLADISYRLSNNVERQTALKAALAFTISDDITVRANEIQRAILTRANGVKAN